MKERLAEVFTQTKRGEGGEEVVEGLGEVISEREVGKEGRDVVERLFKLFTLECESTKCGREGAYGLVIALGVNDEVTESRGETPKRSTEIAVLASQAQKSEVGREMIHI